jgi:hypothetical protein
MVALTAVMVYETAGQYGQRAAWAVGLLVLESALVILLAGSGAVW